MPAKRAPRHPVPSPVPSPSPSLSSGSGGAAAESAAAATENPAASESPEAGPPDAFRRRPRQSRGQKRVELLLDAAATVIARAGLEAATAGPSRWKPARPGSLYQFFPNRDAVLAALALRYADECGPSMSAPSHRLPWTRARATDRSHRQAARGVPRSQSGLPPGLRAPRRPTDDTRSAPSRLRYSSSSPSWIGSTCSSRRAIPAGFARTSSRRPHRRDHRPERPGSAGRAVATEKKPLLDDLRRVLLLYSSRCSIRARAHGTAHAPRLPVTASVTFTQQKSHRQRPRRALHEAPTRNVAMSGATHCTRHPHS